MVHEGKAPICDGIQMPVWLDAFAVLVGVHAHGSATWRVPGNVRSKLPEVP